MQALESDSNPNPRFIVDPPWPLRTLISRYLGRAADVRVREKRRAALEARRKARREPHRVEYFHQWDDPYSHLAAQVLERFAARYDVEVVPHLMRATGGKDQPEQEKLARWARRDCELIAPHYGLSFPSCAPVAPTADECNAATEALAGLAGDTMLGHLSLMSTSLWSGERDSATTSDGARATLEHGSERLAKLGHYSGATFYYGGEFYWGVDRLFHLEQRLMSLGLRTDGDRDVLVPRPAIEVEGVDASDLTLHFYPSLNSPYTSIIYDRTIEMARACNIQLKHKPVLPMVMRGVPATPNKSRYIVFDTKREAEHLGVPFGPLVFPIGAPTRDAYSLFAWAASEGKDIDLLSALLRLAFAEGVSLASKKGMRLAVTQAGLDWNHASKIIGNDSWIEPTTRHQQEMVEGMGLWGVPCYRLCGPGGEPDLMVWGQDRLWLVAAEIRRRAGNKQ